MELDLRALNENRLKENIFTHDAVHTQKQYREMQFVLENESDIERGCAHKKNMATDCLPKAQILALTPAIGNVFL